LINAITAGVDVGYEVVDGWEDLGKLRTNGRWRMVIVAIGKVSSWLCWW
jgi:hypothetical protein